MLYSFSNVLVTIVAARAVTAAEFGAFAFAMAVYLVFTEIVRGLTSETLTIRYGSETTDAWKRSSEAACGFASGAGILVGIALVVMSPLLDGNLAWTMAALGLSLPGLALQDSLRFAALAKGKPGQALVNDVTQLLAQLCVLVALIATGHDSPGNVVLAWGVSAYVAAVVSSSLLRLIARPTMAPAWIRVNWDLSSRLGLDNFITQGAGQVSSILLAAVSGLTAVGSLRAVQTIYKPTAILGLGIRIALVPELARTARVSSERLRREVIVVSAVLGSVSAGWAVLLLIAPDGIGEFLLGDSWEGAAPLIAWFAVAQVANGIRYGPEAGLRAMQAGDRTLVVRLVVSAISIVALLIGTIAGGVLGLAIASALVRPVEATIWWTIYRRFLAARECARPL